MQLLNDYGYKNKLNIDDKTYLLNFNAIKKQIDINQIDGDIGFSFNENILCIIFNQKLIIQCSKQEIKLDEIVGDNLWYDMESQVGIIVNEKPFKMKKFIVSEENGKLKIKFNLLKIQDINVNELMGFKIQVIDNTFYLIGGWDEQFNMNQKMIIIKEVNKKEDIEVIKLNEWDGIVYPNLIVNQQKEIILIGGIKNKEMELNQENYLINNQKEISKINNNNNNLIQLNNIASYQFQLNNNYYLIGGYNQQLIKHNNLNYYQLQSNNQLIFQSEANLNISNINNNGFLTFNKKQIINSNSNTDNDLSLKLGLGLGLSIGLLLLISFIYFIYKKKANYRRPQFQLRPKKLNRVKTSRQSLLWDENNNSGNNNNNPGNNNNNNNNKEFNSNFNLSKRLEPSYQLNKIE